MLFELIGIAGGIFILIAFLYASTGRWNGKSFWYELYNLFGAILLVIYTTSKHAYTNIVLNFIWGVVALFAVVRIVYGRNARKKKKPHKY